MASPSEEDAYTVWCLIIFAAAFAICAGLTCTNERRRRSRMHSPATAHRTRDIVTQTHPSPVTQSQTSAVVGAATAAAAA